MSELIYYLKPNGEKDVSLIEIPAGKVTIGRGPFLRCTDKRVSRNHAELTLTLEGDLSITPKHVNPTYHRDNSSISVYQSLEKEKSFILKPGDSISLLPDSLTYEIIVKNKLGRMNALLDENKADVVMNEDNTEEIRKNGQANYLDAGIVTVVPGCSHKNESSTEENKPRELPNWLIEMAENTPLEEKNSTSNKKNSRVKKISVSENKINEIREELEKPNQTLEKDVEQDENICVVSKVNSEAANAGTSAVLKKNRPVCEFGGNCYRKNTNHKLQYSHPGDDDYNTALNDASDDDRPECEYGTDCYRKNPDHKNAFKHSEKPKRKAVIKAKRRKENETENDDESDEYDESFIDDSDEYDPKRDVANYSSDEEDMEALNKEAKAFIKNKKL